MVLLASLVDGVPAAILAETPGYGSLINIIKVSKYRVAFASAIMPVTSIFVAVVGSVLLSIVIVRRVYK